MKTLFSIALLFGMNNLHSQTTLGLKGGLNIATVNSEEIADNNARIGYHIGGFVQTKLAGRFVLRPELLYSVKGYSAPNSNAMVGLYYINFPLLAGYKAENLTLLLGPEFGLLTSAKSKIQDSYYNITQNFRDYDIGVDLAAAYTFTKKLGGEFRYCYGFKGLQKGVLTDENGNIIGVKKVGANRVLQLSIYYLIK